MHLRVRRWAIWILGALLALMAASGVWLVFRYEPGGDGISSLHSVLGLLTVFAALTVAVTTALDEERSTAGVLPAIVVLGVVAGLYLTGPALAYEQVAANGPIGQLRGILVLFDDDVGAVARGNEVVQIGDYRTIAWLHVVALPVALLIMGLVGIWAVRRRAQLRGGYVPKHAASPVDEVPPA